jgi:hypothetical protein
MRLSVPVSTDVPGPPGARRTNKQHECPLEILEMSETEAQMREENERLKKENEQLRALVQLHIVAPPPPPPAEGRATAQGDKRRRK